MKSIKILLIVIFSALLLFTTVRADEDVLWPNKSKATKSKSASKDKVRFILGVEGGVNLNMFSQDVAWTNYYENLGLIHPTAYESHSSGSGVSPHFGILGDIPFNDMFSLQIRADLDFRNYGNSGSGFDYIHTFGGGLAAATMNYDWQISSIYTGLDVLARINIVGDLFVTGGFDFQYLVSDMKYKQTFNVTDSDPTVTLNDFPYWNWVSGGKATGRSDSWEAPFTNANSLLIGLEAGIGYKIPLTRRIWLVPQGRFQYFFTPIASNENWTEDATGTIVRTAQNRKLMALQFVLALWFGF